MITDAQNRPTTVSQSLVGTGTIVSTDSIDLQTASRNVGRAFGMRMAAFLQTALVGATSVQVQMITSASGALTTPTVIATGPVVAAAAALAGTRILDLPIPGTAQRYLGLQFLIVGTSTAGTAVGVVVAETDNQPYVLMNLGL